jgi:hypothetical protein
MFDDPTENYKQQEPMHDKRHQKTHARSIKKNRKADDRAMVGAMTVAFGATAALATHKMKPNIVSSLAEKAMSVAAPVVPTKKDGEVDHERLVAVLADLGQKGGVLRLVG